MPLPVLVSSLASQTRPGLLSLPTIFTCLAVYAAHLIARGPRTSRDRDLHDRLFIVTGVFDSAIALGVVEELARRGARVIGIAHPKHFEGISVERDKGKLPGDSKSVVELLLESVRTRSKNKEVFLDPVDISSPQSIREFSGKLIKSENRLDGLVFCHEYRSVGTFFSRAHGRQKRTEWEIQEEMNRQMGSLATFYVTTLFLPSLLAAPTDRDIRIVNVVNPFYAAALSNVSHAHFSQSISSKGSKKRDPQPGKKASTLVKEGIRSLRMIVFMRHLQTVLNALPTAPVPNADQVPAQSLPFQNDKTMNKGSSSNISVCSVNPGISLSDTVHPLLGQSWIGMILYIILFPIFFLLTKSSYSALQTILHTLFVPTAAKLRSSEIIHASGEDSQDEIIRCLLPGALYANCSVVRVKLPTPSLGATPGSEKRAAEEQEEKEDPSDVLGRQVWEMMERDVKYWDESEKEKQEEKLKSATSSPPD